MVLLQLIFIVKYIHECIYPQQNDFINLYADILRVITIYIEDHDSMSILNPDLPVNLRWRSEHGCPMPYQTQRVVISP